MPDNEQGEARRELLGQLAELAAGFLAAEGDAYDLDWLMLPLETVDAGVLMYGPEGKVIAMNGEAEAILGIKFPRWQAMSPDEQANMLRMEMPDGRPILLEQAPRPRALRGEATYGFPMVVRRGDGSRVMIVVSAVPVRDPANRVIGAVTWLERAAE